MFSIDFFRHVRKSPQARFASCVLIVAAAKKGKATLHGKQEEATTGGAAALQRMPSAERDALRLDPTQNDDRPAWGVAKAKKKKKKKKNKNKAKKKPKAANSGTRAAVDARLEKRKQRRASFSQSGGGVVGGGL